MKILYVVHQFFPEHIGGTEVYTLGLAQAARAEGHEVAIATYHESELGDLADFRIREFSYEGLPVYEFHYNLSVAEHPARFEYNNTDLAGQFRDLLIRLRPEIVHFMHAMKISGSALECCGDLGVPFIVTLCDYWFLCPRHSLLTWDERNCDGPKHSGSCLKCSRETHGFAAHPWTDLPEPALRRRLALRAIVRRQAPANFWRDADAIAERNTYLRRQVLRARRIVALSPFLKKKMVENGYPDARIEVISHGLEMEVLPKTARLADGVIEYLCIGSLIRPKGAHIAIQAIKRLNIPNIRLTIHGPILPETAYIRELRELAAEDPRIVFAGKFEPGELPSILSRADVLLYPGLCYDNEPLVIKAARAAGVTVFASDLGTLRDCVRVGENGSRLISAGDVAEWARQIEQLTSLPTGNGTVEYAAIKSLDQNAREVFALYEAEVRAAQ